jgi:hypothetical protein
VTSPPEEPDSAIEELSSARQQYNAAASRRLQAVQDGVTPQRLLELDVLDMEARLRVLELECQLDLGREEALESTRSRLESTRSRLRESMAASDPPPYEPAPWATANQGTVRGAMPGAVPRFAPAAARGVGRAAAAGATGRRADPRATATRANARTLARRPPSAARPTY